MSEGMPEKWFQTLCEIQNKMLDKFAASVDRFIQHDEGAHREFREAIATLATAVELLRAEQGHQKENWNRVWTVAIAPILGGVLIAVLALVLR